MKVRLGDVKKLIREEFLRGIPEFVLRQATERYVDEIRQHINKFITANKSENGIDQQNAMEAANSVLEDLQEESFNLLNDKLWTFIQQV